MYAFPRKTPLGVVGEEGRRSAGIRELLKSTRVFAKQNELLEAGIIASSISLSINMSNRTPYFLHIPRLHGERQSSKCQKWCPEELPKKALQSCSTPAKDIHSMRLAWRIRSRDFLTSHLHSEPRLCFVSATRSHEDIQFEGGQSATTESLLTTNSLA
jgi:hypothetical protein